MYSGRPQPSGSGLALGRRPIGTERMTKNYFIDHQSERNLILKIRCICLKAPQNSHSSWSRNTEKK